METAYRGKNIQSVQRALDILGLFSQPGQELSLGEISVCLNLNKSTAHGLISTLHQNGYLQQNKNGKYGLGQTLRDKAILAKGNDINYLREFIRPYLDKICNTFSATASGFFYEDGKLFRIYQSVPKNGYYISVNFNDRIPLYCTASGKLLLAYQDEVACKRYLARTKLIAFTEYTLINKQDLLREADLIRRQGYSYENQEHQIDVSSLAAPLYWNNNFCGTCSVTGTAYWIEKSKDEIVYQLQMLSCQLQKNP